MTVTLASKALNVGERGIYHARLVLEKGTPEEIADYARARPAPWAPRRCSRVGRVSEAVGMKRIIGQEG